MSVDKRELVLPPYTYGYMQDITKGIVKTYTGPTVITPTAQEVPIIFTKKGGFQRVESLEKAMCSNAIAVEGSYLELFNPAKTQPGEGVSQSAPELDIGRRVNVPGPVSMALWPGQFARQIRGHHLRYNQYLLVRVYNAEEAEKYWNATIAKSAKESEEAKTVGLARPKSFAVGTKIVVRGDEVSFYIPPTGVVVESDGCDTSGKSIYVRDALTLERLEYSILVKENGTKRYERGPQVVFPTTDEKFIEKKDDKGLVSRKFSAIELNEIQGIHIKVIAPYKEGAREYKEGEEMFITGKDTPIYFPREEHSVVRYDGKTKHFATAVPRGEGRYVMERKNGNIKMVLGAAMLLPNPVDEVIVRRALSDLQCDLWYPGNAEVLAYNKALRGIAEKSPTTRSGAVSEGDVLRNSGQFKGGGRHALLGETQTLSMAVTSYNAVMEASKVSGDQDLVGDEFERGGSYTQPRTVTLNTKFQGLPSIDVWTGFAVQVKDRSGNRRIVQGPATALLAYDEDLEILELSTGKPKTTDRMLRTVYLRTTDNKIADIIEVETKDHVVVAVKVSYRVNFEGDPNKWFAVTNYVKLLCDHGRSLLKGAIRKLSIDQFYADPTQYIRDILLGQRGVEGGKRVGGMAFPENGAALIDVDVLGITIPDAAVKALLDRSQAATIQSAINLSNKERELQVVRRTSEIDLSIAQAQHEAETKRNELERAKAGMDMELFLLKATNDLKKIGEKHKLLLEEMKLTEDQTNANRANREADRKLELDLADRELQQMLVRLKGESEAVVQRFTAAQGGFSEALLALSNNETAVKVAQAWSIQETLGGKTLSDSLRKVFEGTPLGPWIERHIVMPSNGTSSLKGTMGTMGSAQLPQS
jgi:major vault protein